MSELAIYLAMLGAIVAAHVGVFLLIRRERRKAKQADPYTNPEPEHQGNWGDSEMKGD